MRTIDYRNKVGGAILALSLVLGIGIMASTTAQAQDRNNGQWHRNDRNRSERQEREWRRNRNQDRNRARRDARRDDRYDRNDRYGNGSYNNTAQIELNQGYQAGLNTGSSDARRGQSYNPQRSHYYKDARSQQFRNGFMQGYAAGFRQYGGYNNNGDYRRGSNGVGAGSILGEIFGRP
jgi:hypothetical protein